MAEATLDQVRIIGIFAHVDAGKTTTSEAILYFTGRIHRTGSVDDGDTQLDFMEQERERGITIMSAATACHWQGHRINLIDTPGHIDFTAEVVRSIRVIDGATVIICGVGGVEPQTEAVWMHANRENLARLLFINKLDRNGADMDRVMAEVRERLTDRAVPIQLPIGQEGGFKGVVDLLTRRALTWRGDEDEPSVGDIPAEMVEKAEHARRMLIDAVCETDDALLELCLAEEEPDDEVLQQALRRATIRGQIVPVLCGAARKRIGIQPLLDSILAYLPAPVDMPPIIGMVPCRPGDCDPGDEEVTERPDDPDAPLCAAAFKIVSDPHVGHLTWVRVFSGTLNARETVYNPRADVKERVSRIYRMHGVQREQAAQMSAGDVVALVGVKSAVTGDTLCDPDYPITLETFKFPEPVITVALSPSSVEEREKLGQAISRLCAEDPTLQTRVDPETGEQTLAGMGELHLEVSVDRLRSQFGLTPNVSQPQVSYREACRRPAEATGRYKKQTGGRGHFAEVQVRIEPLADGEEDVVFENQAPPADLPSDFVRPTENGARAALSQGILAGYPVSGVKVTLLDGRVHEVDSAAMDFEIAGSMAVRQAFARADPILMEPVMAIDMNIPEEQLGSVVADLGRRRGSVRGMRARGSVRNLKGELPLAESFGYATVLRSITSGRGTFTLQFDRYEPVPSSIADEVVRKRREEGKIPTR